MNFHWSNLCYIFNSFSGKNLHINFIAPNNMCWCIQLLFWPRKIIGLYLISMLEHILCWCLDISKLVSVCFYIRNISTNLYLVHYHWLHLEVCMIQTRAFTLVQCSANIWGKLQLIIFYFSNTIKGARKVGYFYAKYIKGNYTKLARENLSICYRSWWHHVVPANTKLPGGNNRYTILPLSTRLLPNWY